MGSRYCGAASDIFVGLYWQRYGWISPGMEVSGLEDEYRLSHGNPRLIYVKTPAPEREHRLQALPVQHALPLLVTGSWPVDLDARAGHFRSQCCRRRLKRM